MISEVELIWMLYKIEIGRCFYWSYYSNWVWMIIISYCFHYQLLHLSMWSRYLPTTYVIRYVTFYLAQLYNRYLVLYQNLGTYLKVITKQQFCLNCQMTVQIKYKKWKNHNIKCKIEKLMTLFKNFKFWKVVRNS